jgi:Matrixin
MGRKESATRNGEYSWLAERSGTNMSEGHQVLTEFVRAVDVAELGRIRKGPQVYIREKQSMAKSRPLIVEYLEARVAPSVLGLAWLDPTHLTLSFAPDGTDIAGDQSNLFQTLDSKFPTPAGWQSVIVRAFQTWASQTNVSVGVVSDSGDPLGVAGLMQGDPRFGDIRIGARALAPDVMAITAPPDPYFSGTLSGDVILNSSADLNSNDLFAVVLHEAGLALGLGESTDPTSAMYSFLNPQATLSPGDIQNIQALYGTPAPDPNQPDGSFATATPISYPPLFIGLTPLVAYGDLSTLSDANIFSVQPPPLYFGSTTIQLQTSGISFLQPQIEVYDQNFNLVGEAQSTSDFGDIVSVQLPNVNPLKHYYIEVNSASQDVFGTGRYALSITFNNRSIVNPASLPAILRGPYDSLGAGDIAGLLSGVGSLLVNSIVPNNTFVTATQLQSRAGYLANSSYSTVASLSGKYDVDIYQIQAPQAPPGQTDVLAVSLTALPVNGVLPIVSVYDANTNPVDAEVLLNGNGTYLVQATGLLPGATYYLRVSAAPSPAAAWGNYSLVADFGGVPADVQTFVGGTLAQPDNQNAYGLYVAQTQLFQFVLSTSAAEMVTGAEVSLEIFDSTGRLVFSLVGPVGETVSGASVLLKPGQYQVSISVVNSSGGVLPPISYLLRGSNISDPIGPAPEDPTTEPMYQCPDNPAVYCYCYPNGTYSTSPYEFTSAD